MGRKPFPFDPWKTLEPQIRGYKGRSAGCQLNLECDELQCTGDRTHDLLDESRPTTPLSVESSQPPPCFVAGFDS
jgi:hypothetical protein